MLMFGAKMRDRLESRDRSEQWARALLHAILALVGGTFRTIGPADNVHPRQNGCFKFLNPKKSSTTRLETPL